MRLFAFVLLACLMLGAASAQDATSTPPSPDLDTDDPYAALEPYTIEAMRARDYPASRINIVATYAATETFIRYLIEYESDGLTITGVMQVPQGTGPFPVIILNHGYIRQQDYWSGYETWEAAGYLNARGYLTIAPDFRSWGGSDWGLSLFHGGLTVDVLNLLSALDSVPQADTSRIGMWGHSMGGGVTMKVLAVADDLIDAAVLYATNSADDADLVGYYGPGCLANRPAGRRCNRGEVIPEDVDATLYETYLTAAADASFLRRTSPWWVLSDIDTPIQIHIGTADTVLPGQWSSKLYNALEAMGKNATLFWYDGQDHTFRGAAWTRYIERTAAFFDSYVMNAN